MSVVNARSLGDLVSSKIAPPQFMLEAIKDSKMFNDSIEKIALITFRLNCSLCGGTGHTY